MQVILELLDFYSKVFPVYFMLESVAVVVAVKRNGGGGEMSKAGWMGKCQHFYNCLSVCLSAAQ